MMDCMFKGNKETCLICTYYLNCRVREYSQQNHKQDEVKHESTYP